MKMKKTIILICAILTMSVLVSCASNTQTNNKGDGNLSNKAPVQYSIYYDPSAGGLESSEGESTGITLKNAESKIFSFASKNEVSKPSDVEEVKTIELNGKLYSLPYRQTYETAISGASDFAKYGKFNGYKSDTARIDTRLGTGELLFFANVDINDRTVSGNLTADEVRTIADATLVSLYGELAQQEYEYESTLHTDTQQKVGYSVVYRKYVWGVRTNDSIQISVNMKGDIMAINAKSLGMFSLAESQITKEEIDNAIAALHETFSDEWTVYDEKLILDAEGDYYVSAGIYRKAESGMTEAFAVYINVQ